MYDWMLETVPQACFSYYVTEFSVLLFTSGSLAGS